MRVVSGVGRRSEDGQIALVDSLNQLLDPLPEIIHLTLREVDLMRQLPFNFKFCCPNSLHPSLNSLVEHVERHCPAKQNFVVK